MVPFIIHGKDRGSNLRGLTAGVLQGMEMRRQLESDELAKKQDERQQALHSLDLQVAKKDLMLKSAAVRKADLQNEAMELRKGFAGRKRTMQSTLSRGPGVKGKLAEPSQMQRSAMSRLSNNGVKLDEIGLDTQFQGVAVAPKVVQAMENFETEAKFMEEEWGRTMFDRKPEEIRSLKEEWYSDKAESLTTVMKTAERRLIEDFFDDPMMQPTEEQRQSGLHFDGLKDEHWGEYSKAYNQILTDYRNDKASHHDVLMRLENAETQLFTHLYQDRKSDEMELDLKTLGILEHARGASARQSNEMGELTAADVALIEAKEEWEESNKIDTPFSKKANAYLGLVELASAQKLGLTNELVTKRRDQITKEANADNERAAYQNTISYFRNTEQQVALKGLFVSAVDKALEGKTMADIDETTLRGEIIGTVEHSLDGITYDNDVYTDILKQLFDERVAETTAVGAGGAVGADDEVVEEPVAEGDTEGAILRVKTKARGKKAFVMPGSKSDPHWSGEEIEGEFGSEEGRLGKEASEAYKKSGDTKEERDKAWDSVWENAGYDTTTIPDEWKDRQIYGGAPQANVNNDDSELYDWLMSSGGASLTRPEAKAFVVRNKNEIMDAIRGGIGKDQYGKFAGFYNSEWKSILGPVFEADANRKKGEPAAADAAAAPRGGATAPAPEPVAEPVAEPVVEPTEPASHVAKPPGYLATENTQGMSTGLKEIFKDLPVRIGTTYYDEETRRSGGEQFRLHGAEIESMTLAVERGGAEELVTYLNRRRSSAASNDNTIAVEKYDWLLETVNKRVAK